ncbi:MAG TPA: tRNA (N6-isopentenyl adenosine(37)-C2)-methylthiotransferase MiaB [Sphaerochaeta sp.]|nr:tRNA (N6-isopentenyl adenosine(37)-C2)-methylthiotransferase MiaB [Sphaerochaeta sp.]HQB06119.1 tRNA (N6-isopentenyl adenosine(37)-C2)-methylthiotransferase MiaB [Sphaerochaeta sp.]
MKRKYWLETYGCQMNIAESNALELHLKGAGLIPAESAEESAVVILNTCTVRRSADNRIWGRLGYFGALKKRQPLTLVVTGCMAERLKDDLKNDAPYVDFVIGTYDKQRIVDILTSPNGTYDEEETYTFSDSYYREGEFSSYIPIMNGCNNFCSYCIVPYVRGREISRPINDIIRELHYLDSKEVKEVTLLGQNVNSYHYEEDGKVITFPELLRRLCAEDTKHIRWIRFDSPHPKDFTGELIEVIRSEEKVAKHLHIPLQSGSTRILKAMNRKYTKEQFISLITTIRSAIPSVTFATDVMVGFPTESEEEYRETLEVLRLLQCPEAFMYYFNPREGTKAVELEGQIDEETKSRRLSELIDFQLEIFQTVRRARIGAILEVLVSQQSRDDEHRMLGKSEHNEMVAFTSDAPIGSFVTVRLTGLKGNTLQGEVVHV